MSQTRDIIYPNEPPNCRVITVKSYNRRQVLSRLVGSAAVLAVSNVLAKVGINLKPTPNEIEGPFYPVVAQKDRDFDLTQTKGQSGTAQGLIIFIEGIVLNERGEPVENAVVDLWQANALGRYSHPSDPNKAPIDPNFQGWAIVPSGVNGTFRFKTIFPGSYPAAQGWLRPPHIHFKVSKPGYQELTTQMYFPGHELNVKDLLLLRKTPAERELMLAKKKIMLALIEEIFKFTIVLQSA